VDPVGRSVLRLCSVFEPLPAGGRAVDPRATRFDPIGGMQNHTAALTRCLDAQGHVQTVVTSRLAGRRGVTRSGRAAVVHRTGLPLPRLRQLWALDALRVVLRRPARRRSGR
jgi:glycogen(starch) synthase